ncbi:MAG TPA: hypothetical protein VHE55_02495 [Fimbriimonadaceae bacterium]|nr:hypothetical protein [Fimbriimonadaceae bacterium]
MVFQNSIPFGAPSQRRLHMVAGPQDMAYIAVLNQFNEQQGNLHHMTVPVAELEALAKAGAGSVTARGPKASITFRTGDHEAHYDFTVICEDMGEEAHTETEVERSEFEELVATLRQPTTA